MENAPIEEVDPIMETEGETVIEDPSTVSTDTVEIYSKSFKHFVAGKFG